MVSEMRKQGVAEGRRTSWIHRRKRSLGRSRERRCATGPPDYVIDPVRKLTLADLNTNMRPQHALMSTKDL
ncbi:hypothetical protein IG631_22717 [Alternaria alternata]|nr:hypothetical protein IG631_22717 [Alternaria alternata]